MRRLGTYVQVPFCQTKCTYCNFHTGVVAKERFAPYVEAVCREVREHRELLSADGVELGHEFRDAIVDTVYFGGGTPSLLEASQLNNILEHSRASFAGDLEEVTLQADPE